MIAIIGITGWTVKGLAVPHYGITESRES